MLACLNKVVVSSSLRHDQLTHACPYSFMIIACVVGTLKSPLFPFTHPSHETKKAGLIDRLSPVQAVRKIWNSPSLPSLLDPITRHFYRFFFLCSFFRRTKKASPLPLYLH
ncbi:hypothetical protein EX30DRAFT_54889 [Ascodesmis nigricans]|uniref:Uncharacterized protein n=1 Tax=Ascodesmis nigricans TaxID=341454 RepID=A0A4S2MVN2_9PEZI|nr:hypothetical protein EX30DRAFT_54889 [Ascodesmis nigricans]